MQLTLACWDYDRTRPLLDGTVQPEGIDLNGIVLTPAEPFNRMLLFREFDQIVCFDVIRIAKWDEVFEFLVHPEDVGHNDIRIAGFVKGVDQRATDEARSASDECVFACVHYCKI